MDLPDLKALKKLADACRKAGIKSYKGNGMEFTLSDEVPESKYKKAKAKPQSNVSAAPSGAQFLTDSLSEEELLFWSTGDAEKNETP